MGSYNILIGIALVLLIALLLGYNAPAIDAGNAPPKPPIITAPSTTPAPSPQVRISLAIPAIDKGGNGALAEINLRITQGSGRMSIAMGNGTPKISPETQESIRTAFELAKAISGPAGSSKDAHYEFSGTSDLVSGRSAGAAIAILTIAGMEGEEIREDTLITGSIDENGTIGRVGFVLEKARALNGTVYKRLLVPKGESIETSMPETCKGTTGSPIPNCMPPEIRHNVTEETGIEIIEVKTIEEAFGLMIE